MTFIVDRNGVRADLYPHIRRLEDLAAHMRAIANREMPSLAQLEEAPLIDDYSIAYRPSRCLVGQSDGHPRIATGPMTTSELWMIAPELGWARTYSRLYRLGFPCVDR